MTEQMNEEREYNAITDDPYLYGIAKEYLPKKRGNIQRLARAALGIEPLLTDVEVQQTFEELYILAKHTNKLAEENNKMTKKLLAMVSAVSVGVSSGIIFLSKFLELIF